MGVTQHLTQNNGYNKIETHAKCSVVAAHNVKGGRHKFIIFSRALFCLLFFKFN